MKRLLDSNSNVLSRRFISWLPRVDPIIVVNRTLDGQYHRQTIGQAARLFDLELITNESGRSGILGAWATGDVLRAEVDGRYRVGPLQAAPEVKLLRHGRLNAREYLIKLVLAIGEEGAI